MATIKEEIEYTICDYQLEEDGTEVQAVDKSMPSGKDVSDKFRKALMQEVRFPKEFGGEMSGYKIPVDPGYEATMVIEYKEIKKDKK